MYNLIYGFSFKEHYFSRRMTSATFLLIAILLLKIATVSCSGSVVNQFFPLLDEQDVADEQVKSLEEIRGLTEDAVSETLSKAKEEILEEEKRVERNRNINAYGHTHQDLHYRSRYDPALEPARKRALILERTMGKLADSLG